MVLYIFTELEPATNYLKRLGIYKPADSLVLNWLVRVGVLFASQAWYYLSNQKDKYHGYGTDWKRKYVL